MAALKCENTWRTHVYSHKHK